jgi:DNA segregation ATPase FtsK/SpoIIIE, S-DNA-T family
MRYFRKIFAHSKVRSVTLFIFAALLCISFATYNSSDPSLNLVTDSSPNNLLIYFGSYTSDFFYQLIGKAAFIIPICGMVWSYLLFRDGEIHLSVIKTLFMLVAICFCSASLNLYEFNTLPAGGGGIVGYSAWYYTEKYIVNIGELKKIFQYAYITTSFIFLILALGIKFQTYKKIIVGFFSIFAKAMNKTGIFQKIGSKLESLDSGNAFYAEGEFASINPPREKYTSLPGDNAPQLRRINTPAPAPIKTKTVALRNSGDRILPSIDLLDNADNQSVKPQSQSELQTKSEHLLSVLHDFGVKGKIIDVREGPVVTMYEFEPAAGTKSSRVIGLSDDIARSLSAISTRISIIPGKNALGIELPNKKRMFFRLKELIETKQFADQSILLPIVLGKDLSGTPLVADLAKMPHLLVAGTTGSGKSVAINTMIMSLLYRYTPEECRMIMIDPKMLELSAYDNIPHLMTPVVTEPGKAVVALKWAVKEMENRYRLMSHLGVRSIANYNVKLQEAAANGEILERKIQTGFDHETGKPIYEKVPIDMNKMPFIVVIVDEMADLMLVAGKDIETSIQRLAQMARAAGIHIIMATQRPSVDVITGVIKANFPSRISFKVTSKIDSRTILGEQGSEQLLGMGDMLYMGNSSRILRVHGPFVDDKEVERVTNFLRQTGTPEYISAVTESMEDDATGDNFSLGQEAGDDMYTQAVNIVRTERKSSISYIQRTLRIGYNRAANLVEEMEKNGILSEPNHSGKREVLLPED